MNDILNYFVSPTKRFFVLYLISAGAIALLFFWIKNKKISITDAKDYWLHPSAKLDYIYFIVVGLIKIYVVVPLIFSAKTVMLWTNYTLLSYFGYVNFPSISREIVILLYTITLFIVSDFSRYILHRAMHEIPFLWNFHKVHHTAEVLNPITFYRVHPIENLLFGFRYSIVVGFVTGIFIFLFGAKVQVYGILGANIFIFVFNFIGGNLRHSHIELSYPRFLERFFISPRQHQLHHSYHFTRYNYGGYLAIWDTIFSTVKLTADSKPSPYGLGDKENKRYHRISALLFTPFVDVYRKWKKY